METDKIRELLSQDGYKEGTEIETTDIYLLPPHEDPETCTSWLRMRNRDGHYTLMFEETVCDGDVMISPRIKFEVGVRILGGLMALGYEVGAIMKRRSRTWSDEMLEIKIDWIEGLDRSFTQIQGKVRAAVEEAGHKLGLEGRYIPHSYIEQVQLEEMTEELRHMTMEMKDKFVMAANRGYDVPALSLERSNSGLGMASITVGSAGRGRKEARNESVTRLQDAVRKKRKDSRSGAGAGGSDNGWGSNGGEHDVNGGVLEVLSPPPRPPSRPHSRTGRPPHHGQHAGGGRNQSVAAVAGDHSGGSGDGSGGDEGDFAKFYGGGYHTVASPYHHQGGYGSPASVALEGRLNMLTQRVDDLAQAHKRHAAAAATAAGVGGGGGGDVASSSVNTLVQSQMLLSAKLDAIAAKSSGEERSQLFLLVAAAGGAAVALLVARLADVAFSRK